MDPNGFESSSLAVLMDLRLDRLVDSSSNRSLRRWPATLSCLREMLIYMRCCQIIVQMLFPNHLQLTVKPIEESLHGIVQKGHDISTGLAGPRELARVFGTCGAIVAAQKVAGRYRYPRPQQNSQFQQSCCSAVSVAKRMDPCNVEMS